VTRDKWQYARCKSQEVKARGKREETRGMTEKAERQEARGSEGRDGEGKD
jgi:hypothetical protein